MSIFSQCKQCFSYDKCLTTEYPYNLCDSEEEKHAEYVNSIEERRKRMQELMMDCFVSPEQHKRNIETAIKSRLNNK